MTDHYAVVGNPVAHSLSPQIHAEFARQTGHDLDYVRLLSPFASFRATVLEFRDGGGRGVNVTLPFKREAWELASELSEAAQDAQAVNVLDFRDGAIRGDNTDGVGVVTDLQRNMGFSIAAKRILVMGAGGATHGVMSPILDAGPALLVVANRTLHKATRLVERYRKLQRFALRNIAAHSYQQLAGLRFDLVINATSAGLNDEMPPLPPGIFAAGAAAYDMVYGKRTPFMEFARLQGVSLVADGLGMLVEQAAESFRIWRGVRPETAPVIAALRAQGMQ
jgi:shikimate dehydrogenase